MLEDRRGVPVGLEVHKSSVCLGAVAVGALLDDRTLEHDHEVVIAALGRWPGRGFVRRPGRRGLGCIGR